MSDEAKTGEQGSAGATGGTQPAPAAAKVPDDVIAQIKKDATAEAIAEAKKAVQQSHQAQNQRIIQAINGGQGGGSPQVDERFWERFASNPLDVLAAAAKSGEDRAVQRIRQEQEEIAALQREQTTAAKEVLDERPDITSSPEARELLGNYFDSAPENLSTKEKISWAVNKYDKLMEKSGLGNSEERVKKAKSPSAGASGGGALPPQTGASYKEREQAATQSEQQERIERFKKSRHGITPMSLRRA